MAAVAGAAAAVLLIAAMGIVTGRRDLGTVGFATVSSHREKATNLTIDEFMASLHATPQGGETPRAQPTE